MEIITEKHQEQPAKVQNST